MKKWNVKRWLVYGVTMPEGMYDCEELPPNGKWLTREEVEEALTHTATSWEDDQRILHLLFGETP